MISKLSIENLKNSIDIVDIVSSFLELQKSGVNYKACCPFHGESSPSFVVSPKKQIYHCFGCGMGGDAIKFVMEYEKLTYPEALEKIAAMNNFTLEYENNSSGGLNSSVLEAINDFYKTNLPNNETALNYLISRGVSKESISRFEIGYAPISNETLNFLKENYFNLQTAQELGIIDTGTNGLYARFIERITFPIYMPSGKLAGFGGRTITNHPAKYINSPVTKLFNKSSLLFGYHLAKNDIYRVHEMIITEGYFDVVMLHQVGFTNSVATLGTALTQQHLPLLKKSSAKLLLAYDGDRAGLEAARKASILLSSNSFEGGVVIFADGMDPADYVKENRVDELKSIFSSSKPFTEFVLDSIVKEIDIFIPENKQTALDRAGEYLKQLQPIIAQGYKNYLANILHIHPKYINLVAENKSITSSPHMRNKRIDISELQIIKGILEYSDKRDAILQAVDRSMFQSHQNEFDALIKGDTDKLSFLQLQEELKDLSQDEYKQELLVFLARYYQTKIEFVEINTVCSFSEKVEKIRSYRELIQKLRSGVLVRYKG